LQDPVCQLLPKSTQIVVQVCRDGHNLSFRLATSMPQCLVKGVE
jgi:hypothetical protein